MKEFADQIVTALTPMHPVEVTKFPGILDAWNLNCVERNLASLLKVPAVDFGDRDSIRAWAKELPGKIGL